MSVAANIAPTRKVLNRRQSVGLVFLCTLIAAVGQMLIKTGARNSTVAAPWTTLDGVWTNLWAMASNLHLIAGYTLYGVMTAIFVVALRDEELSILFPVISLSYVWVTGLSIWLFGETVNAYKVIGVLVIMSGVAVLGQGGKK